MSASNGGHLRRFKFHLERWVQRGIFQQMILMATLVAGVAALGGLAAWSLTPVFESLPAAIWWSFLRLTDPGYLGDDEGVALRVISTTVTVLGYVLFMGSLIAIMTQWLTLTIRKLESGLTPIAMQNHFVILGWTNRTEEIIKKLLSAAGRLDRFFAQRRGSSRLRIVVLTEEVDAKRRLDLREGLGRDWRENQVFLRSGSSLQREHLERLDLGRAAVIIVPGADFELGGAEQNDTRVVKTLLNLKTVFQDMPGVRVPSIVTELFDPRKVTIARDAIGVRTEVIAGDRLVSRILSQSLRHPGVGAVLLRLLTHRQGNGLYLRKWNQFTGSHLRSLTTLFPSAIVLGVVRTEAGAPIVHLDPTEDVLLEANDRIIFLAETFDKCTPSAGIPGDAPAPRSVSIPVLASRERHTLLILGWSHKIPTLLAELLESKVGRFDVTILSRVGLEDRRSLLLPFEFSQRLKVENEVGDYSIEHDLGALKPHEFDHILFLASGWMPSSELADARSVMGLLLLKGLLAKHARTPEILVELLDPDSARILDETADMVLVSPRVLSHLLAHVGLLPELNEVFDALICAGGAEVEMRPLKDLGLTDRPLTFAEVQTAASSLGSVALGFCTAQDGKPSNRIHFNPPRDQQWTLVDGDTVMVLSSNPNHLG